MTFVIKVLTKKITKNKTGYRLYIYDQDRVDIFCDILFRVTGLIIIPTDTKYLYISHLQMFLLLETLKLTFADNEMTSIEKTYNSHTKTKFLPGEIASELFYIPILREEAGEEETYDIEVDSENHLYQLEGGVVTHNSGKTTCMAVELLYQALTTKNTTSLVAAPTETQVLLIFDELKRFIEIGSTARYSLSRDVKTPHQRLEFKNGSKIIGFSIGPQSGKGSDKVRGSDAHLIIIDEIDRVNDSDIDAVMAILGSHPDCRLVIASTPVGWRKRFYTYATNKDLGFKEFWFTSRESPIWDEKVDTMFKGMYDENTYDHEINAEFGDLSEGVFKAVYIDNSLTDYDPNSIPINLGSKYILGVDWNKSAGTHMCIIEYSGGKLTLVRKIIVPESESLQTESVDKIIQLHNQWKFKHIFLDAGYGHVQHELLMKYNRSNPKLSLQRILHPIHMQQSIEIRDPFTGAVVKKPAKDYMIQQTARALEDGYLVLPIEEDTNVGLTDRSMGLVQQLRNYRVEAYSIYGKPRYSNDADDTLTAYTLAVGGFIMKEGDLAQFKYSTYVGYTPTGDNAIKEPLTDMQALLEAAPKEYKINREMRFVSSIRGRKREGNKPSRSSLGSKDKPGTYRRGTW